MYSLIYTISMVVLWVANLFNGTGIGYAYRTTEIMMWLTLIVAIICLASQVIYDGELLVKPQFFYTIVPLTILFAGTVILHGRSIRELGAFWPFMLVYILSRTRLDAKALRMTAIAYAVLGMMILALFNYTDLLEGWNPNTIAMIGLFSFLVFTIPFFGMREWRSFVWMPLIGVAYVALILPTGSRSCILVVIIQLLLILRIVPIRKTLESSKGMLLILLVPLGVAVFVVLVSMFGDTTGLTEWSYETFGKSLFNGRDKTWLRGFQQIMSQPLFGSGRINAGYWHNSAIAAMTAIGIVGYGLWIRLFLIILNKGIPYLEDTCVIGSIVAFLVLSCQQSVELGLLSNEPSLIPYLILGGLLGRVNYLMGDGKWQKLAS